MITFYTLLTLLFCIQGSHCMKYTRSVSWVCRELKVDPPPIPILLFYTILPKSKYYQRITKEWNSKSKQGSHAFQRSFSRPTNDSILLQNSYVKWFFLTFAYLAEVNFNQIESQKESNSSPYWWFEFQDNIAVCISNCPGLMISKLETRPL
jgi:hypothetical protein